MNTSGDRSRLPEAVLSLHHRIEAVMKKGADMVEQYMALALQPTMRGCRKRSEVITNLKHISDLIDASVG